MLHSFKSTFIIAVRLLKNKIRNINKLIRIFFQILRIKEWMNACYEIHVIIRIMNIYLVRMVRFKVIFFIGDHRHIPGKFIPLIVHLSIGTVRVNVIVRNRYDLSFHLRICVSLFPHSFQRIPHGSFVGKKDNLFYFREVILHPVVDLKKTFPKLLIKLIHNIGFAIYKLVIYLKDQLTIFFQSLHRGGSLSLRIIDPLPNSYGGILTIQKAGDSRFHIPIV